MATMMNPRHAAALAGLLGLLVPLVVETLLYVHPFVAGAWVLWVWPSSIELMVLHGKTSWLTPIVVLSISIGINVCLYASVGWLGGFLWHAK
jgi:hypothetical protein